MWARVHKLDKAKPLPGGGAIVLVLDERNLGQIERIPSLSTLVAVARILAAKRALEVKFEGKGEVRYAVTARVPGWFSDVIVKAGAAVASPDGDQVAIPGRPGGIDATVDVAFTELAHYTKNALGISDMAAALKHLETRRRAAPLDKDAKPEQYWPAVFELAAIAAERARPRGARWITTRDLPVPFALKIGDSGLAKPTVAAQEIVEGRASDELVDISIDPSAG